MDVELRPHQAELVALLTSQAPPAKITLASPPGSGAQTALVAAAGAVSRAGGLVVIVTSLRLLADQWAQRLENSGSTPVAVIRGGSELRQALSRGHAAWPRSGAVVATDRGLGTGAISSKIDLRPQLLILDEPTTFAAEAEPALRALEGHASTTIVRINSTPSVAPASDGLWVQWMRDDVLPNFQDRFTVHQVPYALTDGERELILRSREFLEEIGRPVPPEAVTRRGLESRLTRLETDSSDLATTIDEALVPELDDEAVERLDGLLNSFDDLPPDPRLESTRDLVREGQALGEPVLIAVESLRELGHVLGYLRDHVGGEILELTSRMRPEELPRIQEALADGATVVGSFGMIRSGDELPTGCRNIWWTVPRTEGDAMALLGVGLANGDIQVFIPLPDPPLTSAPLAIDGLLGPR